mgnify:CR=1 FL=1
MRSICVTCAVARSFNEKAPQLNIGTLVAFGIKLTTRYDKVDEMCEMLHFAQMAALAGAATFVHSVFYDSKADICSFELTPGLDREAEQALWGCAKQTITQFHWVDGGIYHSGEDEQPGGHH